VRRHSLPQRASALDCMPNVKKPPPLRVASPGAPLDDDEASPKSVTDLSVDSDTRPTLSSSHFRGKQAIAPSPPSPGAPPSLLVAPPRIAHVAKSAKPAKPAAAVRGNGISARLKRQRAELEDADELVPRERHPLNRGKRPCYHSGMPGKLYHRHDIVSLIVDSMLIMHHRLGWRPAGDGTLFAPPPGAYTTAAAAGPSCSGTSNGLRRCGTSDDHLFALGFGPAPMVSKSALCNGCTNNDEKNFFVNKEKEQVCNVCGVVSSGLRISTHREKACTEDEDKTTHADKPYELRTDRFDHPAQSCEELRKQREREAAGTRISKKAKHRFGLGWTQEHAAREAAKAERERAEMSPRDQTKSQHIQVELDNLFTPLEPLDNRIKRFCRMEADRAWREAVRHSSICSAGTRCPLRIKEKGPAVIADAILSCCISTLLEGEIQLDGVTHAALMVVANKLGAQQVYKGTSCALRAVRTVVATLLSHTGLEPVPSCPNPTAPIKPHALGRASPCASPLTPLSSGVVANAPFLRVDSSVSDFGEPESRLLQLRDAISVVHKALGTSNSGRTRDHTLIAIQDAAFRCALDVALENDEDVSKLPIEGLAFALMNAVSLRRDAAAAQRERRSVPTTLIASFGVPLPRIDAAVSSLAALLPSPLSPNLNESDENDFIFQ